MNDRLCSAAVGSSQAALLGSLSGHYWTLRDYVGTVLRPPEPPPSRPWTTELEDPEVGPIRLRGHLSEGSGELADHLLIVVHGITGCAESGYARRAAAVASKWGLACLRLNLRGADRSGEDFYHAGLTDDLHAVLLSADLDRFPAIHVLGYSLGGHVALRFATEVEDPRVRSVAAVSAPLDLSGCAAALDRTSSGLYRRRILKGLAEVYSRVAERREVPVDVAQIREVRSIREFDGLTVVPRFGFADVDDYYTRMSVGPLLQSLRRPALLAYGAADPLVPEATLEPYLRRPIERLSVWRISPGGHVGFPPAANRGQSGPPGVESQLISWSLSVSAEESATGLSSVG